MKRQVITYNAIEGFHHYPNAPVSCHYLKNRHRHIFVIRCTFDVSNNNREIEINTQQNQIEMFLESNFGHPCEFGAYSCEDIAEVILNKFPNMTQCSVKEDDYGGATLTR